ncbi:MAG: hypothetical protein II821_03060 [Treponema sp.]|nr:hypothetical protein [Treponema sp.]
MLKRKMFLAVMCSLALGAGFISCSGDDSEDTSEVKKTEKPDTPDTPSDVEKPDTPVISEEEKEVEEPSAKIAETPVLLWSYDYYGKTMTEQIFDEKWSIFRIPKR